MRSLSKVCFSSYYSSQSANEGQYHTCLRAAALASDTRLAQRLAGAEAPTDGPAAVARLAWGLLLAQSGPESAQGKHRMSRLHLCARGGFAGLSWKLVDLCWTELWCFSDPCQRADVWSVHSLSVLQSRHRPRNTSSSLCVWCVYLPLPLFMLLAGNRKQVHASIREPTKLPDFDMKQ